MTAARHVLHAEWTKLRTLRSTAWLALALVVATVGLGAARMAAVDTGDCPTPTSCHEDTTALALGGVVLGQAAVVALAVGAVTGEHASGSIVVTLAAVPRRGRVLAAKAAVVSSIVLAGGVLAVAGSLLAGRLLLPGQGFDAAHGYPPLSPVDGPTLRAAVGTVAYLALVALLGVGAGALLRDTAAALTAVLGVLYLFPLVAGLVADPHWQERLQAWGPMTAGLAVQATVALDRQPVAPWTGLAILAAWAATALAAGAVTFLRRDA